VAFVLRPERLRRAPGGLDALDGPQREELGLVRLDPEHAGLAPPDLVALGARAEVGGVLGEAGHERRGTRRSHEPRPPQKGPAGKRGAGGAPSRAHPRRAVATTTCFRATAGASPLRGGRWRRRTRRHRARTTGRVWTKRSPCARTRYRPLESAPASDRKSTRLN